MSHGDRSADKGTLPSVNLRFGSDICHLVEPSETSESVEGHVPMGISSGVMAMLLNFRPIFRYRRIKETREF